MTETERLWLREYREDDAAAFLQLNSNPEVLRFTGDQPITSLDEAVAVLRAHPIADYQKHGFGRWACILKSSGQHIGFAGLKLLPELGEVEVGYRFLPEYWGQGLASEAAIAAVTYGFEQVRLTRIIGLVMPDNHASVRVLEKAGLRFEKMMLHRTFTMACYARTEKD